ncbi:MAG: addiction module antidote protein, HigA family [Desulfobulbaceae bacterium DB1]|nr:MAG: addiction module antidote protein, HigA family [Desulfobulbaceae bacterium DB1]
MNTIFNPPHPGEVLREEILKPLGLTVTMAAPLLGISRKSLSRIVNCQGGITPEMAIRLEMAFKPSAESWLRHQIAYDLWQTRQKVNFHVNPIGGHGK